jgi:hypothetical protein
VVEYQQLGKVCAIDSSTMVVVPDGPAGFVAEIPTNLSMLQNINQGPTETGAHVPLLPHHTFQGRTDWLGR